MTKLEKVKKIIPKIVIPLDLELFPDQIARIKKLGDVKFYNDWAKSPDDWFDRVKDADIICGGKFGLKERYQDLEDVFISLPFVGTGFFDKDILRKRNIVVSRSPGCNKVAVSEWIVGMIFNLLRRLPFYINNSTLENHLPPVEESLKDKHVVILGQGDVGSRVGNICKALEMEVSYFKRNDNLLNSVKNADVIVDALSSNPSTKGLLNEKFFLSLKKGSYFITVTGTEIYDTEAIIKALDKEILAGAAMDAGSIKVGDTADPYYQTLLKHPKILATPHIAYNTWNTKRVANDMMIDNVEAWLNKKPINLV
ncbi:MAG: NAD(P)-dependent oxidoreductase [Patescibacteria group bacterium]|jgi:phosphoglycerate dehydrogenase-like enzyme